MRRRKPGGAGSLALRALLLAALVAGGSCWGLKRQKPAVKPVSQLAAGDGAAAAASQSPPAKVAAHGPRQLPPNTFLRIFALPSFEAKLAQHRIGELLASACKNHARVGSCRLYSAQLNGTHVRMLRFEQPAAEGGGSQASPGSHGSVVAYALHEDEKEVEAALAACSQQPPAAAAATQENGADYRCFASHGQPLPSNAEVLGQLREPLERIGIYQHLANASQKAIFLASDPKHIVYHEATKLVGERGDPDFFLQTLRVSFRRIVEWVAFQTQRVADLTRGSALLWSHAEDLEGEGRERQEVARILQFLQIEDLHVADETVTANKGEVKFQKERLRAAIQALPVPLLADIEEFLQETVQDARMLGRYLPQANSSSGSSGGSGGGSSSGGSGGSSSSGGSGGSSSSGGSGSSSGPEGSGTAHNRSAFLAPANRTALWPSPALLQALAVDNTVLVTAATCAYAPLVINWIKHVYDAGVPCYLVIALDDALFDFLNAWVPGHVVRAPPGFTPTVPRQYAARGSAAMRHVSRARLATLQAITDQGYHATWLDADIAVTRNIFSVISRWYDLAFGWTGGPASGEPLPWADKTAGYELKFDKERAGRKVSPAFLFVRGSPAAQAFLASWREAASSSHFSGGPREDGEVLDELLRRPDVSSPLNVQMVAEADFPSGEVLFSNSSAAYQAAWAKQPPSWAHADAAAERDEKIKLLAWGKAWKVQPDDPLPTCPRPDVEYLANGSTVALWPPPGLEAVAQDNLLLLTAANCGYGDLVTNWVKHVWDLGIRNFFIAAADGATYDFLHAWVPGHTALTPANMQPRARKFTPRDAPEFAGVAALKPRAIRAALAQGFRAAWSDADVAWLRNPLALLDKQPDLVVTWADNSRITPGVELPPGTFPGEDKGRKVGSAFVYANPGPVTMRLMEAWAARLAANASDETAALNQLLLEPQFHGKLTIGVFPSAAFPTAAEAREASNPNHAKLEEAWAEEKNKPAWLHADASVSQEGKAKLFQASGSWRLDAAEPQLQCPSGGTGRRLGDGHSSQVPQALGRLPEHQRP